MDERAPVPLEPDAVDPSTPPPRPARRPARRTLHALPAAADGPARTRRSRKEQHEPLRARRPARRRRRLHRRQGHGPEPHRRLRSSASASRRPRSSASASSSGSRPRRFCACWAWAWRRVPVRARFGAPGLRPVVLAGPRRRNSSARGRGYGRDAGPTMPRDDPRALAKATRYNRGDGWHAGTVASAARPGTPRGGRRRKFRKDDGTWLFKIEGPRDPRRCAGRWPGRVQDPVDAEAALNMVNFALDHGQQVFERTPCSATGWTCGSRSGDRVREDLGDYGGHVRDVWMLLGRCECEPDPAACRAAHGPGQPDFRRRTPATSADGRDVAAAIDGAPPHTACGAPAPCRRALIVTDPAGGRLDAIPDGRSGATRHLGPSSNTVPRARRGDRIAALPARRVRRPATRGAVCSPVAEHRRGPRGLTVRRRSSRS